MFSEDGNQRGDAYIHTAIAYKNNAALSMFLQNGGNPNGVYGQWSHLNYSIKKQNVDSVQILLDNKADPNSTKYYGKTPLYFAIHEYPNVNIVAKLLKAGGDGNFKYCGVPLLNFAVIKNSDEIVDVLLENGVNPNNQDVTGSTALHIAGRIENMNTYTKIIEAGGDLTILDIDDDPPTFGRNMYKSLRDQYVINPHRCEKYKKYLDIYAW
jgi:ankyrin repeat protein